MDMSDLPTEKSNEFTHISDGLPTMVDVVDKPSTRREAEAEALVLLGADILSRMVNNDIAGPKGPIFQTAIIAGTMAAKKTSELIPFCHALALENCSFQLKVEDDFLRITCKVVTTGKTGVEMEAMTGASVAALTVYDMCKALNKAIRIEGLQLISKTGGKSGNYHIQP